MLLVGLLAAHQELDRVAGRFDPAGDGLIRLADGRLAVDLEHEVAGAQSARLGQRALLHERDDGQRLLVAEHATAGTAGARRRTRRRSTAGRRLLWRLADGGRERQAERLGVRAAVDGARDYVVAVQVGAGHLTLRGELHLLTVRESRRRLLRRLAHRHVGGGRKRRVSSSWRGNECVVVGEASLERGEGLRVVVAHELGGREAFPSLLVVQVAGLVYGEYLDVAVLVRLAEHLLDFVELEAAYVLAIDLDDDVRGAQVGRIGGRQRIHREYRVLGLRLGVEREAVAAVLGQQLHIATLELRLAAVDRHVAALRLRLRLLLLAGHKGAQVADRLGGGLVLAEVAGGRLVGADGGRVAAATGRIGREADTVEVVHGEGTRADRALAEAARIGREAALAHDRLGRDVLQVLDALLAGGRGRLAARHGRLGRRRRRHDVAQLGGTRGRLDHLELEAALLELVLDERDRLRVALADHIGVGHLEYEVVEAQAGQLRRRVHLHVGDLMRALLVAAHAEAEALVVRSADQVAHANAVTNLLCSS